ncbi:kin of IRRE-like protein 1 [Portunus trituberculatus]|uniref:kin of IRRE-like protein 1 n=1 Tax=Portunus trituberculatus TaxID=210409 RepID=UPI001E1CD0AC|nr:kin of IRRE-like protein 1 [Portunus trituberculatus]XP_045120464.1 kin of IRRE-like protein 1 [Portunus trituberculatus]XP_045120465.1 kin of IRRE-like protein 1 [Portunus trituberculatus]XP_045120466.1 kin of IRRE-like protein 1 [Portunus trituberculatus]
MVYFDHDNLTNLTVIVGHRAALPCRVLNLNNKDGQQVSWIRQRDLHILTVGIYTYTADDRFKVVHATESDEWTLQINPVAFRDAGVYECQVSSSPKISLPISLSVEAQKARIEGPSEVYIQNGSTIRLTCIVNTHYDNVGVVSWFRDTHRLDYDSPRGGVSIEIEKTPTHTTSKLFITPALRGDSGNYTCGPQCAAPASVLVLVVNGEESAAVHKAGSSAARPDPRVVCCCPLMLLLLLLLSLPLQQCAR